MTQTQDAFGVLEDGRQQMIRFFTNEDGPVTVGLLIDSSGYVSTNSARDGAFRQIRVVVDSPNRKRFVVRTRGGYLAGAEGCE